MGGTTNFQGSLEIPRNIQPVHPKDQSWVFIGRTDVEAETPILWPPDVKSWLIGKDRCWERLRAGGQGDNRGWDGWMASLTQWTWVWWTLGVGDGKGGLECCGSWGRKESETTERLNWTDPHKMSTKIHIECLLQNACQGIFTWLAQLVELETLKWITKGFPWWSGGWESSLQWGTHVFDPWPRN